MTSTALLSLYKFQGHAYYIGALCALMPVTNRSVCMAWGPKPLQSSQSAQHIMHMWCFLASCPASVGTDSGQGTTQHWLLMPPGLTYSRLRLSMMCWATGATLSHSPLDISIHVACPLHSNLNRFV